MVFGEDDRFPHAISVRHLFTRSHQMLKNLVHGIFVEQPAVERFRLHGPRDTAVLIPFQSRPSGLFPRR
jgi:hypothetical protein